MKRISGWARQNQLQARMVIVISWILLTLISVLIGTTLKEMNVVLPGYILIISIAGYFLMFLMYPNHRQRKVKCFISFYAWQKTCDMIVAAASFMMVLCIANKPDRLFSGYEMVHAANIERTFHPTDSVHHRYKSLEEFSAAMKGTDGRGLKWKERRRMLKTQIHEIRKADNLSKGNKTLLIILSAIVATGLLILVGSAACSLSCNGSDAAAVIVGIGGTALVVWLLIMVIRKIQDRGKPKPDRPDNAGRKSGIIQQDMRGKIP